MTIASRFRATGFETMVREGIKLEVGNTARLDFDLTIGDSRTVVTVHGGPPLMNTENASVGTVIDRDNIDQMPLNGRGIQTLDRIDAGRGSDSGGGCKHRAICGQRPAQRHQLLHH